MSGSRERSALRRLYAISTICVLGALGVLALLMFDRASHPCGEPRCEAGRAVDLPKATLRYGESSPEVVLALFVDFASPSSRQAFTVMTETIGIGRLGERAELQLFHAPSGGCAPGDESFACLAARTVECAEVIAPGAGVQAAGAAFDLQWAPPEEQDLDGLAGATLRLGIEATRLRECVRADAAVQGRVAYQTGWARGRGLAAGPAGFIVDPRDDTRAAVLHEWVTRGSLLRAVRCLRRGECEERPR